MAMMVDDTLVQIRVLYGFAFPTPIPRGPVSRRAIDKVGKPDNACRDGSPRRWKNLSCESEFVCPRKLFRVPAAKPSHTDTRDKLVHVGFSCSGIEMQIFARPCRCNETKLIKKATGNEAIRFVNFRQRTHNGSNHQRIFSSYNIPAVFSRPSLPSPVSFFLSPHKYRRRASSWTQAGRFRERRGHDNPR